MSTRPLVFEGSDPERLILEAWSVHGTHVRISEPVMVRKGGVFGFFAKAHYRIEVLPGRLDVDACAVVTDAEEVPAARTSVPAGAVPATPASSASVPDPAAVEPAVPRPTFARPTFAAKAADAPAAAGVAAALEALVADTEDVVELATAPLASFDSILDKVASSLGTEPSRDLVSLDVAAARDVQTARDVAAAGSANDLAGGLPDPPRPLDPHGVETRSPGPPPVAEAGGLSPTGRLSPALAAELSSIGFPLQLLDDDGPPVETLADAFAALPSPRPLPRSAGALVAVAGRAAPALPVARSIAAQLAVPADQIARALPRASRVEKAGHLVVSDPREAADLSPGWRRDRVGVVLVAVPPPGAAAGPQWTRSMLHALAPSMTLLLASATAKTEDVAARCAAVGGADALLLEDLDLTSTPASVLAAGIPVATLDGEPATPAAWAAAAERALERQRCVGA